MRRSVGWMLLLLGLAGFFQADHQRVSQVLVLYRAAGPEAVAPGGERILEESAAFFTDSAKHY